MPPTAAMTKPGDRIGEDEGAGHDGEDRRAIGDERRRVVEQGLALDERHHDARRPEAAEHGRGGEGVGWGDDRPEGERGSPAQVGDGRLGHGRDD